MKNILLAALMFFAASCASTEHQSLRKIKVGMSKDAVLDIAGNPSRSSRISGADRWSYDYWSGDKRSTMNVHFVEGSVSSITDENPAGALKDKFKPLGK